MNGDFMYELAKQRIAEQQEAARRASEARQRRAAARANRARKEKPAEIAVPVIPDFPHEMFETAGDVEDREARSDR